MARIRVNIVCLVGIAIAFISMMCAWTWSAPVYSNMDYQLIYLPPEPVPWLFIIGTLIALLSPLGGIIQLASIIEYILLWMSPIFPYDPHLSVFPFIAGFSSIIVLYSIRSPRWIQLDRGEIPGREISTRIIQSLLTFWVEPNPREESQESVIEEA